MAIMDKDNAQITDHLREALPGWASNKIVRLLLDGDPHIQTIGQPHRILTVTALGDGVAQDKLNWAEAGAEPIKVLARGKSWRGLIRDPIAWSEVGSDYYMGEFVLLVSEEVTL